MINEIKRQIYLGSFTTDGEVLDFKLSKSLTEVTELGDIVYFFVHNDKVVRVGKAGGKKGFTNRINMYKRGVNGDSTNKRIIRIMLENNIDIVHIYCVKAPRVQTSAVDVFSGETIDIEAPTNVAMESFYMQKLIDDHDLEFCYQLS